ncbi:ogr/Delta-like zinc finger family protein [Pantoea ananatis]|uniref:ogr/Delta-like zinc finger family protein n=1 Tax=Pantoea ananas TaxID=553 RepID=UPI0009006933|nr:ogr/Delta-like zinc finger family protein [Pantoea ananatis]
MRIMKMTCPVCLADATIRKTNRKHPQLSDVDCQCTKLECGHTFVVNVSFSHTISPSALAGDGRVRELLNALGRDERKHVLELLREEEVKS